MVHIFADEAGNFDFSPSGTRYFIVTAVTMRDCDIGAKLLALRHRLALEGYPLLEAGFHAAEDKQVVRDAVFALIATGGLDIDAVVLDKRKTEPRITADEGYFYQLAWHMLFKYIAPRRLERDDDLLLVASSLGTKARKVHFGRAIGAVVQQHAVCRHYVTASWSSASHPCLQVADYCGWAIQRAMERNDKRSLELIEGNVRSMFEPFSRSTTLYY